MTITTRPAVFPAIWHYKEVQDGGAVAFDLDQTATYSFQPDFVDKGGGVPKWRTLIAEGRNASTKLEARESKVDTSSATMHYGIQLKGHGPEFGYRDLTVRGQYMDPPVADINAVDATTFTEKADNQAIARFYAKLASVESAFKGMVFTGEIRETLHAIKHPAQSLRRGIGFYLDQLKRAGRKIPKRHRPRFVRDTWLEYMFGWRPLINDVHDAINALYASRVVKPIFQMVKTGGGAGQDPIVYRHVDRSAAYGFFVSYDVVIQASCNIRYQGVYRSTGAGVAKPSMSSFGLSAWEFVPTLWELIPYSFLVDYFTNVGGIIASWSYRSLGTDWVAKNVKWERSAITDNINFHWAPDYFDPAGYDHWIEGHPGVSVVTERKVLRVPEVIVSTPSLELHVPGMTSLKWINILALSKNLTSTRKVLNGP